MKISYLDFEKPISELEAQTLKLKETHDKNKNLDISKELSQLEGKTEKLLHEIYDNLNAWQISQVSRHPQRPYTLDYIEKLFTDFEELHGDRAFADDPAIVGGLALFEGIPVMVIGHQKGRDVKERQHRNFGMPKPEGYRKALRLYKLAEKFNVPIVTLIDTPGAYPGINAEERGQSEAIARNLYVMAELKVPIIGIVIGEGGSGGALALGVVDQLIMLQFATYSVISPEGCASILWKSADKASTAAETLGITATRLKDLGLIDTILPEPLGGAHRNPNQLMETVRKSLKEHLTKLQKKSLKQLLDLRYERLLSYGKFKETAK
ncbi:acetyl-CoA carboxylase carboxyltransferase subunit alpha [Candidatus Methylopumilus universalis]|jgi:acetyl-CoA carboxylase carboxyl transferase subunit alpha|uniref:Acetyl-coenzyme A carboxylase carboxyl transferase subunit alpha n=1 Tax=Candidatus Methylopumilus universalis TaxID=2588536 RepID=A0AAX1EZU5_9PROT|nr:acetyl-CoA carboxylase carboxyltransferase subunit alpha [Candidatus Methylopumilus universalis]QDC41284.1 acetyl-CoA carboxylase carboxyltransferase subunit alpha [Candidatus Methylopumilus universalis]QDC42567.1 acetyl-CoA carboxylase carboxyltransferase subunit alpha [Candidatus Methylopumilus universalis]QDC54953.1 acetyl-CoA carboxylase carboxyltransferase subunit alpha [Candidatus Methylopumilus universalis]QDC56234.1 acetyl-CoA carboxylase carboxyltransferase subunit alpha [Candidatus